MTQISTAQAPPKRKRSKAAFILAWLAFFVMIGAGIAIYFGVTGVAKAADVSTVVEGFKPERDLIASADVGFEAEFTSVELQPGEYSVVIMGAGIVYESQSDIGVLLEDDTGLTTRLEAQPVFPPNLVVRAAGGEELELRRPAFENASRAGDIESATYADFTVRSAGEYEFRSQGPPYWVQQVGIAEARDYTIAGATSWFGDLARNGGLVIGGIGVLLVAGLMWLICFFIWLFSGRQSVPQPQPQPQIIYVQAPAGAPPQQYAAEQPPTQAAPAQATPPQNPPPEVQS